MTFLIRSCQYRSTYLGGSGDDGGASVAVDNWGNAYLTGSTTSPNFPTASPIQSAPSGGTCTNDAGQTGPCPDAFVASVRANGAALLYSTYLGGTGEDEGNGITVDGTGVATVTGATYATNFPTTPGAYHPTVVDYGDAFVTQLSAPEGGGGSTPLDATYSYDALGNLLTKDGRSYSYGANGNGTGAGPHQARTVGGQAYSYDANGNLQTGGGRSYAWNADNQPTSITGSDNVQETYAYDADGTRVSRTRNNVTTIYLGGLVEQEGTTTRTHYVFHGQVIAQREGSTVIYLHGDHLGSISVATSATGAIVSKQEFTPWGAVRSGGIGQTTLNYTGQRKDGTGLLYYGARYYDPGLARFVSADSVVPDSPKLTPLTVDFHEPDFANTLGDEAVLLAHKGFFAADTMHTGPRNPQTLNRYSYVGNNPLRTTDPTGHGCAATTVGSSCEELYDTNGQAGTAYEAGEGAPEGGDGPAAEAATNERGPSEESERVAEPKSAGEGRASGRGRGAHPEAETGDEEGRVKNNSRGRRGSAYNRPPTGKRPKNYRTGVTEKVRAKNNGKCIYCGEDADTNDHVKPWEDIKQGASSRGEEIDHYNDTENMEPACGSCNSSKGVRDAPNPNRQRR